MKVLMLGAGEVYHSEPVAQCIKRVAPSCRIAAHGLFKIKEGQRVPVKESEIFDKLYLSEEMFQVGAVEKKNVSVCKAKGPNLRERNYCLAGAHVFYHACKKWYLARKYKQQFEPLLGGVDVLHLHSIFENPGFLWLLTKPEIPLIVSCWGSDVLRTSDIQATLMQKAILDHASVITVSNLEFKEIVLAKYGRHLEDKITYCQFNPMVESLLNSLAYKKNVTDRPFGKREFNLCIGHNGTVQCNHREILQSISELDTSIKNQINLYIPMTYGAPLGYIEEIESLAHQIGCRFTVFKEYMSEEEVFALRTKTDVLVYAPVSDAFSATVTQALAAGSVVIAGAWLPYKTRVMDGFKYHEIYKLSDIGEKLIDVLGNWEDESRRVEVNKELSRKIFSEEAIGKGWVDAYQLAIENFKNKKNG